MNGLRGCEILGKSISSHLRSAPQNAYIWCITGSGIQTHWKSLEHFKIAALITNRHIICVYSVAHDMPQRTQRINRHNGRTTCSQRSGTWSHAKVISRCTLQRIDNIMVSLHLWNLLRSFYIDLVDLYMLWDELKSYIITSLVLVLMKLTNVRTPFEHIFWDWPYIISAVPLNLHTINAEFEWQNRHLSRVSKRI